MAILVQIKVSAKYLLHVGSMMQTHPYLLQRHDAGGDIWMRQLHQLCGQLASGDDDCGVSLWQ